MSERGRGPLEQAPLERVAEPVEPADGQGVRVFQADFLTALFRNPLDPGYAQAAAARAAQGPLPPWRRQGRRLLTVLTLIVIGALLIVAYQQRVARAPQRAQDRANLIAQIKDQEQLTEEMAVRAEELQLEVAALRERALSGTEIARLREFEAATGVRKVIGDGLVVKIADGPAAETESEARISAWDLQSLSNQLWALGAEAIAINGQRLTSTTSIRKAGAIHIGITPILGPYEIAAIGPDDLAEKFNDSLTAQFYGQLRDSPVTQLGFSVQQRDDLELPAAVQLPLRFATVPSTASPSPSAGTSPTSSPSSSPSGGP